MLFLADVFVFLMKNMCLSRAWFLLTFPNPHRFLWAVNADVCLSCMETSLWWTAGQPWHRHSDTPDWDNLWLLSINITVVKWLCFSSIKNEQCQFNNCWQYPLSFINTNVFSRSLDFARCWHVTHTDCKRWYSRWRHTFKVLKDWSWESSMQSFISSLELETYLRSQPCLNLYSDLSAISQTSIHIHFKAHYDVCVCFYFSSNILGGKSETKLDA